MGSRDDAWLRHQQARWMAPDGDRWVRTDAARFLAPGGNLAAAYPALALKYNPNQPRVPAGHSDGGQWTNGSGGFAAVLNRPVVQSALISDATPPMGDIAIPNGRNEYPDLFGIRPPAAIQDGTRLAGDRPEWKDPPPVKPVEPPPEIPRQLPATRELRMGLVRRGVEWVARMGRFSPAVDVFFGALDQIREIGWLTDMMKTANDPPGSLRELQDRATLPSEPGYENHHVVGQFNENRKQFSSARVDAPDNLVRIPRLKHIDISGWYSRPNPDYKGRSPRDYLRGKSWDEQRQFGLKVLRDFGVLK